MQSKRCLTSVEAGGTLPQTLTPKTVSKVTEEPFPTIPITGLEQLKVVRCQESC
jgi:hypothetical protein